MAIFLYKSLACLRIHVIGKGEISQKYVQLYEEILREFSKGTKNTNAASSFL